MTSGREARSRSACSLLATSSPFICRTRGHTQRLSVVNGQPSSQPVSPAVSQQQSEADSDSDRQTRLSAAAPLFLTRPDLRLVLRDRPPHSGVGRAAPSG